MNKTANVLLQKTGKFKDKKWVKIRIMVHSNQI